jgi:hypothetical protein
MIVHAVGVLVANALLAGIGVGVLMLIDGWRRLARWSRPAVALLLGQATFVVAAPWVLYAGMSISPLLVEPLIAVVLAAGILVHRRRNLPPEPRPGGGGWIATALAGGALVLLGARASYHALFQFDTISNWVTKGIVIWAGGHRLTGVLDPRFFARPDLHPQSHLEYPVGFNALLAWDFHWMGTADTWVVHLQLALLLAGAIGTAWVLLRPILPALPLAAGLAGLVLMPSAVDAVLSAYADLPLACVWATGAIALMRWHAEGERYLLALATVVLAAAVAMKQDGGFYDVAIYVGLGIVLAVRERRRLLELAASAGIVALTTVPWRAYNAVHGIGSTDIRPGISRMQAETGNLRPTLDGILHVFMGHGTLFAMPLAVGFAIACIFRNRRTEAIPFLIAAGIVVLAVVLIYWNAAVNLRLVLVPALGRILIGLIVLAWLLLPALVYGALMPAETRVD